MGISPYSTFIDKKILLLFSHPTIDYIVAHGEEFPLHFKDLSVYALSSSKHLGASIKALQL